MSASFTTFFNLAKPATGDLDWGPEVDGNFDVIDTALRASQEDRFLRIMGGGTLTYTALSGQIAFTANIVIHHGVNSFVSTIPASESPLTAASAFRMVYALITRNPTANETISTANGNLFNNQIAVPATNTALLLAIRDNNSPTNRIILPNGQILEDGIPGTIQGGSAVTLQRAYDNSLDGAIEVLDAKSMFIRGADVPTDSNVQQALTFSATTDQVLYPTPTYYAVQFTVGALTDLSRLAFRLSKVGSPTGTWNYAVIRDSAGLPSTTPSDVVYASANQNVSALPVVPAAQYIAGSPTLVSLLPGTYWFALRVDGTYQGAAGVSDHIAISRATGTAVAFATYNGLSTVWTATGTKYYHEIYKTAAGNGPTLAEFDSSGDGQVAIGAPLLTTKDVTHRLAFTGLKGVAVSAITAPSTLVLNTVEAMLTVAAGDDFYLESTVEPENIGLYKVASRTVNSPAPGQTTIVIDTSSALEALGYNIALITETPVSATVDILRASDTNRVFQIDRESGTDLFRVDSARRLVTVDGDLLIKGIQTFIDTVTKVSQTLQVKEALSLSSQILFEVNNTGTAGDVARFRQGGVDAFRIPYSGGMVASRPLLFSADNTHDIGAAGATRPRSVYAATSFVLGSTLTITPPTLPADELRFLRGDGTWSPAGSGLVTIGLTGSDADYIFDGTLASYLAAVNDVRLSGGGTLLFLPGTYTFAASPTWRVNVKHVGMGMDQTILALPAGTSTGSAITGLYWFENLRLHTPAGTHIVAWTNSMRSAAIGVQTTGDTRWQPSQYFSHLVQSCIFSNSSPLDWSGAAVWVYASTMGAVDADEDTLVNAHGSTFGILDYVGGVAGNDTWKLVNCTLTALAATGGQKTTGNRIVGCTILGTVNSLIVGSFEGNNHAGSPSYTDYGNQSGVFVLDWDAATAAGYTRAFTLTGNLDLSTAWTGGAKGRVHTLIFTQDGTGGRTITWPANVVWLNDTGAPSIADTAAAVTAVHFLFDGTNYHGYKAGSAGGGAGLAQVNYLDSVNLTLPATTATTVDGATIVDKDIVLFTALSNGAQNKRIFKATVSGVNIVWTLQKLGQASSGDPTDGDTAYIKAGTVYFDRIFAYSGTAWYYYGGPAGATGELQFNDGGKAGADSQLFWDKVTKFFGIGHSGPTEDIHLKRNAAEVKFLLENTNANPSALAGFQTKTGVSATRWQFFGRNSELVIGVALVADYFIFATTGITSALSLLPTGSVNLGSAAARWATVFGDILHAFTSMRRGSSTRYTEEAYIDSQLLSPSTTAAVAALTFDTKVIKGVIIDYTIYDGIVNRRRTGTLKVVVDAASGGAALNTSVNDAYAEIGGDINLSWSAVMSGDNCELQYTTGANFKLLHADVKRFLA